MYNFSIRASSRYYECSAFESVRFCVRGDIHSEFITDGRFCVLCTLEFTSFPYCCNKCNYDHRLLFVLTLRFAFIFIASAASFFGDDIIACNQILNSLSTDDATLRQWHSDPVNLMDNAIKWAIDGKYNRKKTIQSEFKSTIFFMWPSHTHTHTIPRIVCAFQRIARNIVTMMNANPQISTENHYLNNNQMNFNWAIILALLST